MVGACFEQLERVITQADEELENFTEEFVPILNEEHKLDGEPTGGIWDR